MSVPMPSCDWWLEDRSKCPHVGLKAAEDYYGAPLNFCLPHWRKIDQQSHYHGVRERRGVPV